MMKKNGRGSSPPYKDIEVYRTWLKSLRSLNDEAETSNRKSLSKDATMHIAQDGKADKGKKSGPTPVIAS